MKKLFILALIGSQLLLGCRTSEVVAGAIGVGVGVGLSRWYDRNHDHRHHRGHRHYRYGNYYGDRYGYYYGASLETAGANTDAQVFADKHGVSLATAKKVQRAFATLPDKGLASFKAIGLDKSDLKAIAKNDLPSASSIKEMAAKLDISEAQARDLLLSMNKDFEAQASNINSTYWKSCMKEGEWSTPQNSFCTKASRNGCSPATGASMCY